MEKIKISAVSYLNTLPFIYGIENNQEFLKKINLQRDIPSTCAKKLLLDEVDLGLIPVAVIPQLKEYHIISDYCIGAVDKVDTVLLLSDVPLNKIENIYLDYHSRTSVRLCQLLAEKFWKIKVNYLQAEEGFIDKIQGKTAGVLIGDRTFKLSKKYQYIFDLSEEWMRWQKLPFVFAAWVSNKKLPQSFIKEFNKVLKNGVENIDKAIEKFAWDIIPKTAQAQYLKHSISYSLDKEKRKGLQTFLKLIS